MQDHTVTVDRSGSPATLAFADNFNVVVPFIDRHLDEGRSAKVMMRTTVGGEVTYGELAESVNRAGNALLALGIGSGERLLMIVKDAPEFMYLFWGAIKAGIVPVPLNTLLKAKDYQFMIEDSGCASVVYSPEFAGEVEPALEAAAHAPAHAFPSEGDGKSLFSLMADAATALKPMPATAEQDCFWLYSSGTTGKPKGTVHTHRDMVVASELYAVGVLGMGEDDISFSAAKLFFAYGLGNAMTFPLWVGASAVLLPGPPTPDSTFEVIEKFKPTFFFGVPTLYAAQLKALDEKNHDLSSLRICVSAGEGLPPDILRRWREKVRLDILDGIGSTEATHIFISNRPGDVKPGATGRLVPGYDAKVVDENGNEVAAGDSGQLMIRGDSAARYYWNNPEKTAETMVDGWLNTGDTYIKDKDGYFFYCGRSDDMLKVGGIWCSPFEIEARLIEHPKVLEAAVIGRDDENGLTKPAAYVVLNNASDSGDAMAEELIQHCKDGLAKYKYPRWIEFIEDLPKTATGKIQRFKLR